jgi:hemolysin III
MLSSPLLKADPFEEIANLIVAFLGLFISLIGFSVLISYSTLTGKWQPILASSIYGTTLILLFLASILYHAALATDLLHKHAFQIIDHCAIYLLIAGSFTPMGLVTLHGSTGFWMLGLLWGVALLGCLYKVFKPMGSNILSTLAYVAMGWSITLVYKPLMVGLTQGGITLVVIGGLFYTLGSVFYIFDHKFRWAHALWHGFVLGGSISHYLAILFFVILPVVAK